MDASEKKAITLMQQLSTINKQSQEKKKIKDLAHKEAYGKRKLAQEMKTKEKGAFKRKKIYKAEEILREKREANRFKNNL